jgi:Ni,Fe-hydrogenase maturation factor
VNPDNIRSSSFCTHSLPIKVMTDYLLQSFNFDIIIIGIQPKNLLAGASPSKEVLDAVESLAKTITSLLQ